ncbi:hypothetical protein B0H10DRAFT_2210083 [Mycena sp. CBHHK59/15]|nr:hypothetical protein B0H10DRAFT_2210083 [Mycena sp. CBHHK59/15]
MSYRLRLGESSLVFFPPQAAGTGTCEPYIVQVMMKSRARSPTREDVAAFYDAQEEITAAVQSVLIGNIMSPLDRRVEVEGHGKEGMEIRTGIGAEMGEDDVRAMPFRFLDLGCCPGGFASYILGKNPRASSVGISLPTESGGHSCLLEEENFLRFELHWADLTQYQLGPTFIHDPLLQSFPVARGPFDLVLIDGHPLYTYTATAFSSHWSSWVSWLSRWGDARP